MGRAVRPVRWIFRAFVPQAHFVRWNTFGEWWPAGRRNEDQVSAGYVSFEHHNSSCSGSLLPPPIRRQLSLVTNLLNAKKTAAFCRRLLRLGVVNEWLVDQLTLEYIKPYDALKTLPQNKGDVFAIFDSRPAGTTSKRRKRAQWTTAKVSMF